MVSKENRKGRNTSEQSAASGPEVEVTGLAFLMRPMWKDGGLNERKYDYKLPFVIQVCLSHSQQLQKSPGKKIFKCKASYNTTARKSQWVVQPVSWPY